MSASPTSADQPYDTDPELPGFAFPSPANLLCPQTLVRGTAQRMAIMTLITGQSPLEVQESHTLESREV